METEVVIQEPVSAKKSESESANEYLVSKQVDDTIKHDDPEGPPGIAGQSINVHQLKQVPEETNNLKDSNGETADGENSSGSPDAAEVANGSANKENEGAEREKEAATKNIPVVENQEVVKEKASETEKTDGNSDVALDEQGSNLDGATSVHDKDTTVHEPDMVSVAESQNKDDEKENGKGQPIEPIEDTNSEARISDDVSADGKIEYDIVGKTEAVCVHESSIVIDKDASTEKQTIKEEHANIKASPAYFEEEIVESAKAMMETPPVETKEEIVKSSEEGETEENSNQAHEELRTSSTNKHTEEHVSEQSMPKDETFVNETEAVNTITVAEEKISKDTESSDLPVKDEGQATAEMEETKMETEDEKVKPEKSFDEKRDESQEVVDDAKEKVERGTQDDVLNRSEDPMELATSKNPLEEEETKLGERGEETEGITQRAPSEETESYVATPSEIDIDRKLKNETEFVDEGGNVKDSHVGSDENPTEENGNQAKQKEGEEIKEDTEPKPNIEKEKEQEETETIKTVILSEEASKEVNKADVEYIKEQIIEKDTSTEEMNDEVESPNNVAVQTAESSEYMEPRSLEIKDLTQGRGESIAENSKDSIREEGGLEKPESIVNAPAEESQEKPKERGQESQGSCDRSDTGTDIEVVAETSEVEAQIHGQLLDKSNIGPEGKMLQEAESKTNQLGKEEGLKLEERPSDVAANVLSEDHDCEDKEKPMNERLKVEEGDGTKIAPEVIIPSEDQAAEEADETAENQITEEQRGLTPVNDYENAEEEDMHVENPESAKNDQKKTCSEASEEAKNQETEKTNGTGKGPVEKPVAVEGVRLDETTHDQTLPVVESGKQIQNPPPELPSEGLEKTTPTIDEKIEEKPEETETLNEEGQEDGPSALKTKGEICSPLENSRKLEEIFQEERSMADPSPSREESCLPSKQVDKTRLEKEQTKDLESLNEENPDEQDQTPSAFPSVEQKEEIPAEVKRIEDDKAKEAEAEEDKNLKSPEITEAPEAHSDGGLPIERSEPVQAPSSELVSEGLDEEIPEQVDQIQEEEGKEAEELKAEEIPSGETLRKESPDEQTPHPALASEEEEQVTASDAAAIQEGKNEDEVTERNQREEEGSNAAEAEETIRPQEEQPTDLGLSGIDTCSNDPALLPEQAQTLSSEESNTKTKATPEKIEDKPEEAEEEPQELETLGKDKDTADQSLPLEETSMLNEQIERVHSQNEQTKETKASDEQIQIPAAALPSNERENANSSEIGEKQTKEEENGTHEGSDSANLTEIPADKSRLEEKIDEQVGTLSSLLSSEKQVLETPSEVTEKEDEETKEAKTGVAATLEGSRVSETLESACIEQKDLRDLEAPKLEETEEDESQKSAQTTETPEAHGDRSLLVETSEPDQTPSSKLLSEGLDEQTPEQVEEIHEGKRKEADKTKVEEISPGETFPKESSNKLTPPSVLASEEEEQLTASDTATIKEGKSEDEVTEMKEKQEQGSNAAETEEMICPQDRRDLGPSESDTCSNDQTPQQKQLRILSFEESKKKTTATSEKIKDKPEEAEEEPQELETLDEDKDAVGQSLPLEETSMSDEQIEEAHSQNEQAKETEASDEQIQIQSAVLPSNEQETVTWTGIGQKQTKGEGNKTHEGSDSANMTEIPADKGCLEEKIDEQVETLSSLLSSEKQVPETPSEVTEKEDEETKKAKTAVAATLEGSRESETPESVCVEQKDLRDLEAPKLEETEEDKSQKSAQTTEKPEAHSERSLLLETSEPDQAPSSNLLSEGLDEQTPEQVEEIHEGERKEVEITEAEEIPSGETIPKESSDKQAPPSELASEEGEQVTASDAVVIQEGKSEDEGTEKIERQEECPNAEENEEKECLQEEQLKDLGPSESDECTSNETPSQGQLQSLSSDETEMKTTATSEKIENKPEQAEEEALVLKTLGEDKDTADQSLPLEETCALNEQIEEVHSQDEQTKEIEASDKQMQIPSAVSLEEKMINEPGGEIEKAGEGDAEVESNEKDIKPSIKPEHTEIEDKHPVTETTELKTAEKQDTKEAEVTPEVETIQDIGLPEEQSKETESVRVENTAGQTLPAEELSLPTEVKIQEEQTTEIKACNKEQTPEKVECKEETPADQLLSEESPSEKIQLPFSALPPKELEHMISTEKQEGKSEESELHKDEITEESRPDKLREILADQNLPEEKPDEQIQFESTELSSEEQVQEIQVEVMKAQEDEKKEGEVNEAEAQQDANALMAEKTCQQEEQPRDVEASKKVEDTSDQSIEAQKPAEQPQGTSSTLPSQEMEQKPDSPEPVKEDPSVDIKEEMKNGETRDKNLADPSATRQKEEAFPPDKKRGLEDVTGRGLGHGLTLPEVETVEKPESTLENEREINSAISSEKQIMEPSGLIEQSGDAEVESNKKDGDPQAKPDYKESEEKYHVATAERKEETCLQQEPSREIQMFPAEKNTEDQNFEREEVVKEDTQEAKIQEKQPRELKAFVEEIPADHSVMKEAHIEQIQVQEQAVSTENQERQAKKSETAPDESHEGSNTEMMTEILADQNLPEDKPEEYIQSHSSELTSEELVRDTLVEVRKAQRDEKEEAEAETRAANASTTAANTFLREQPGDSEAPRRDQDTSDQIPVAEESAEQLKGLSSSLPSQEPEQKSDTFSPIEEEEKMGDEGLKEPSTGEQKEETCSSEEKSGPENFMERGVDHGLSPPTVEVAEELQHLSSALPSEDNKQDNTDTAREIKEERKEELEKIEKKSTLEASDARSTKPIIQPKEPSSKDSLLEVHKQSRDPAVAPDSVLEIQAPELTEGNETLQKEVAAEEKNETKETPGTSDQISLHEEATKEIYQENKLMDVATSVTKETQKEELFGGNEEVAAEKKIEETILPLDLLPGKADKLPVEKETVDERPEQMKNTDGAAKEINPEVQKIESMSAHGIKQDTDIKTEEPETEKSGKEGCPSQQSIAQEVQQLEKTIPVILNKQIPVETLPQENIEEESQKNEVESTGPGDIKGSFSEGKEREEVKKKTNYSDGKKTGEPTLRESTKNSLSDLLQKVKADTSPVEQLEKDEKEMKTSEEGTQVEEAKPNKTEEKETAHIEEGKTEEEKDKEEDGDEHEEDKTSPDSIVMVEARDTTIKTPHKKSHNILSGVGSKVKHSISKVKKAITGKSSHTKPV